MSDVEPLTITEQNALKWVALCERFRKNPLEASALDFVPKESGSDMHRLDSTLTTWTPEGK